MKRALVMSGGGGLGAYQVGVLKALSHKVGHYYDEVYGVSVGAVNGAKIVLYPKMGLPAAAAALEKMWLNLSTSDVHKRHFPFGMAHVLWNGTNVFNTSPLQKLIKREFDPDKVTGNGYGFFVGTVSWTTGKYRIVDHNHAMIEDFIYASSVFPMAFKPIKIEGEWWIDGGVRNAVPLRAALEAGADEVDMILTEPAEMESAEGEPELLTYGPRILGIMANEIFTSDFADLAKNTTAKINVYRPSSSLQADPLSFDKVQNQRLIERGLEDALKAAPRS